MSQVTISQCEVCKKRVDDSYAVVGWIHQRGRITVSRGRKGGTVGDAQTGYADDGERDFCSLKCFVKFMERLA